MIESLRLFTRHSAAVSFLGVVLFCGPAQGAGIEEIIVTAQKRAESVQDVPIAISAFSGENLEELGVRNLSDVGRFASGVEMHNSDGTQPTYSIRGVQTFDFTAGSDPTVAVYVDGIYAARGAGAEIPLVDIERVEILKGPQGTLFGRNAIGGAIHIITAEPSPESEGSARVSVGNHGRRDLEVMFNQPLTDTMAARLTLYRHKRDGWLDNIAGSDQNQEDNRGLRLALEWAPSDDWNVLWRAAYSEKDQFSGVIPTITDAIAQFGTPPQAQADPFDEIAIDGRNGEERELFTTSLEVVREFDDFTLTAITGWRSYSSDFWQDEDGSANNDYLFNSLNDSDEDLFSQEIRFTGENDRFKWTLGGSYSRERIDRVTLAEFSRSTLETFAGWEAIKAGAVPGIPGTPLLTESQLAEFLPFVRAQNKAAGVDGIFLATFLSGLLEPCGPGVPDGVCAQAILPGVQAEIASGVPWVETLANTGTFESTAIYGDMTWTLTERLNLSVGARYTYDEKEFSIDTRFQNTFLGTPFGLAFFIQTPTDPQDYLARFAGCPLANGVPVPCISQELEDDWEALSGRLVLDYAFSDTVMGYAGVSTGFKSGGFNSLNFGPGIRPSYDSEELINYEAGLKGDFLDGRLRLNTAVYFYQYDDLQELDLVGTPIPSYNLRNADAEGSGVDLDFTYAVTDGLTLSGSYSYLDTEYTDYQIIPAVGETPADDLTGEPRAGTPRNRFNMSLVYTTPVRHWGEAMFRLDYLYSGERRSGRADVSEQDPVRVVDSYDQWNGRMTFLTSDAAWEFALWGRNLTDEEIVGDFGNIGQAIGSIAMWPLPPRLFGLDVVYHF
jgi:iron complex outermembrane receptor protein